MEIAWALNVDGGAQPVELFRDGEPIGSHAPGVTTYTDSGLSANTRYTYEAVATQAGLSAEATAATLAHPPQGGGTRSVHWTGFEFYIVDERNPAGTEYRVTLGGGGTTSDWGADRCRVFDGLPRGTVFSYEITARNLDGVETQAANRRAGEAGQGPEWATTRAAESSSDPWVAARIEDLRAIYGLTDAAVDWLTNGVGIERPLERRGGQTYLGPGYAGFLAGARVGIGGPEPFPFMHEAMHAFWESWNGWPEPCGEMNFYTFKRDQAQFILDFRDYDRAGGSNPWEAWRPYYVAAVAGLDGEIRDGRRDGRLRQGEDAWQILANREFHKVSNFYHRYETIYPSFGSSNLALVPPPLQKYFRGFLEESGPTTWAEQVNWYSRLREGDRPGDPSDHRLWNMAFVTRDIDYHSPELRGPGSTTRIPEPLRTALRNADRQRLVDFVNTLEILDWEGNEHYSFDAGERFWQDYTKNHLYMSQIYLDELSPSTGIELEPAAWTAVKGMMERMVSDLYCGGTTPTGMRAVISDATGLSALQKTAFGKMVDAYERHRDFGGCLR